MYIIDDTYNVARNSSIVFLNALTINAMNYVFWLMLARLAPLKIGGTISLIFSMLGLFGWLINLGIPVAIAKYTSEFLANSNFITVRRIVIQALIITLSASFVVSGVFFALIMLRPTLYFEIDLPEFFLCIFILLLFGGILLVFSAVYQGFQRMEYAFIKDVINGGGKLFIGIGLLYLGFGVLGIILGLVIGSIVAFFVGLYFIFRLLKQHSNFDTKISPSQNINWRNLIILGFPNFLIQGTIGLSGQLSTITLGFLHGSLENIAWFYVPLQISLGLSLAGSSLGIALLPSISEKWARNNKNLGKSINFSLRFFFVLTLPIIIILLIFPKEFLLLLSESYLPAVFVFRILLIGTLFMGVFNIFLAILNGIGLIKKLFSLSLMFLGSYIVFTVISVWIWQLNGAAFAFTISLAITTFVMFYLVKNAINTNIGYRVFVKIFFVAAMIIIFMLFVYNFLGVVITIVFGVLIYAILIFVLNIVSWEDIKLIKSLLRF